jgi:hypothetical protein
MAKPNGANAYSTTLDGAVDADDTTFVVIDSPPAELSVPFKFRVVAEGANENEICTATAIGGTGNKTWTVTRASEPWNGDSSATAHATGATIEQNLTIGTLRGSTDLLGLTAYAATGDNTISVTTTTDADVDATNLQVTFVAPPSGNVLVKISSLYNDGNNNAHWTIRESTTTLGDAYMSSTVFKAYRGTATIYVTGISAGSHTYKMGAYTSAGTMSIHHGSTGSLFGRIIIEIWAAP